MHTTTAAFLTYNALGKRNILANGWHEANGRKAFVLQNSRGNAWAARENPDVPAGRIRDTDEAAVRVGDEIGNLWSQLQTVLAELDHIVVYVGSRGSERAIALAAQLSADKITFVGCDCGLPIKEALIRAAGLGNTNRLLCECGGHETMKRLFERFMEVGEVGCREAA